MSTIRQEEINSLNTRFSMRMFIADLPRVLNEAFGLIKKIINKIYNCETNELTVTTVRTTTLDARTVIANNIALRDDSSLGARTINFSDIDDLIAEIEQIKEVLNIQ